MLSNGTSEEWICAEMIVCLLKIIEYYLVCNLSTVFKINIKQVTKMIKLVSVKEVQVEVHTHT